jgi:acetyl esterase/lipase
MTYAYDPELQPLLEFLPAQGIEDLAAARVFFAELIAGLNAELDDSGVALANQSIPGPADAPDVALRIYSPQGLAESVPALLYLHGGGFVIGDLESEHGNCLALCRKLGIVIVSVDYRLAPETPYPGALEDCYTALRWLHDNSAKLRVDATRVGVFGMSAGGGLAAATALLARDRKGPGLCFQYLGIPELDDRLATPSMQQFTDTPLWSRSHAELSWDYYLGDQFKRGADNVPIHAAPARADDLSGLPSAYINTMEFDPLRDEGVLYALKLMQNGIATELHSYPGTFHGSSMIETAAVSQRQTSEMFGALRRGLAIDNKE